eukprot:1157782-Pelagomonas_calceolata.AAC.3
MEVIQDLAAYQQWMRGKGMIHPANVAQRPHSPPHSPSAMPTFLSCATSKAARSHVSSAARSHRIKASSTMSLITGSMPTVPVANTFATVSHRPWSHCKHDRSTEKAQQSESEGRVPGRLQDGTQMQI